MKAFIYNGSMILLCAILWIILNEKASLANFLIGGGLGFVAVYFSENYFILAKYRNTYRIKPGVMIKYAFYLVCQIFYSSFSTIVLILSGKVNPGIVDIETEIKDDFHRSILANSITMTPGTVTIDINDGKLKVLWLNCVTTDSHEAGELIKGKLERKLMGE